MPKATDDRTTDEMGLPISGPYAGLDPAQQPVIVDAHGFRFDADGRRHTNDASADVAGTTLAENATLVNALVLLLTTHSVQIECASDRPLHRLVIGDGSDTRAALCAALAAALTQHAPKE